MGKITFVIPYPEIGPVVESTFREQSGGEWEMEVILATGVRSIAHCQIITDVVVARKRAAADDKPILICYTGGAGYNEPLGVC